MTATSTILARPVSIAGYVAPGPVRGVASAAPVTFDLKNAGSYRITGTTKNTGTPPVPVGRLVRLHDQRSGEIVLQVWSDATTGAYSFDSIRAGVFYVVSFDHTNTFGAVIADNLTPEPMP